MPEFNKQLKFNENELLSEFQTIFRDSINFQLQADVDVGVLLSGGVDSSIITALASENNSKIKTFHVGFPGFSKLDETKHARLISEFFDTDHEELMITKIDPDLVLDISESLDEPMVDSSIFPTFWLVVLLNKNVRLRLGVMVEMNYLEDIYIIADFYG